MPSRWHVSLITLFIIASFCGVVFLIFRSMILRSDCENADKRICRALYSLKNDKLKEGEGIYSKDIGNVMTKFDWKVKDDTSEILVSRNKKNLIHVISQRNILYIQDLGKFSWLRQSLSDPSEVEKKLPYQLNDYLQRVEERILKPGNTFKFIENSKCGDSQCYRYQILVPSLDKLQLQQFMYVTDEGKLMAYHTATSEEKEALEILKMKAEITLPQKFEQVNPERNIVLEFMTQAEEESASYDYVKQFEKQRHQNESDTPTPRSTESLTPTH